MPFDYIFNGVPTVAAPAAPALGADVTNGTIYVGNKGVWKADSGQVASASLTGQVAAISATTLYTPTVSGIYTLDWYAKVTVVDGASSTLGALTVTFKDTDTVNQSIVAGGFTQAGAAATTNTGNTTASSLNGNLTINAASGTAIQYAVAYASGTPGVMTYEIKFRLSFLG